MAILDRMDEQLEVGLPDEGARRELLQLYFQRYLVDAAEQARSGLTAAQRVARALRAAMAGGRGAASDIDLSGFDAVRLAWPAAPIWRSLIEHKSCTMFRLTGITLRRLASWSRGGLCCWYTQHVLRV